MIWLICGGEGVVGYSCAKCEILDNVYKELTVKCRATKMFSLQPLVLGEVCCFRVDSNQH